MTVIEQVQRIGAGIGSVPRRARERYSSVLTLPLPEQVDRALLGRSAGTVGTPFSEAPEGLRPVPGDEGLPLLGHALGYVRFGTDLNRRRSAHYGPVWWMRTPNGRAIVVGGPAATREVLTNRDKAFSQEGWRVLVDRFFHRGLMLMDFDEHRAHRRIMQEAFTAERITTYVDEAVPVIRDVVPTWEGSLRLYPALKSMTLDIATRVFMDARSGPEADLINRAFVDCVRAANAFVRYPIPGTRWQKGLQGRAVLEKWFRDALPAKRAGDGDDLFSALCRARTPEGEAFSDTDVVNHMIFLMMAAHDTSTITSGRCPLPPPRTRSGRTRCARNPLPWATNHSRCPLWSGCRRWTWC